MAKPRMSQHRGAPPSLEETIARAPVLIPLHCLVFPPNVPAGADWAVIGIWSAKFRKTTEPCDPPITVAPLDGFNRDGTRLWQIRDGRHRTIAAIIAGRTHIEAEVT